MPQAILVGLLSFIAKTRRVMVLLHLQTGTSRDLSVDLWSWRTAHVVSQAVTYGYLRLHRARRLPGGQIGDMR